MINILKITKIFAETPGARHRSDGPYTGQEFREEYLAPMFEGLKEDDIILIDFDGAYGYPTSFLEESFGGLARQFGAENVLKKLKFKCDEEPNLIDEVIGYINRCRTE